MPRTLPLLLSVVLLTRQSPPSTRDLVSRLEEYVDSYGEKASIVVCTERYTQGTERSADDHRETRALTSDFAIVRADTIHGWLGFRDVLEVDGRRVADREDRLARVLMAAEGRYDEAERLSNESARYNIGSIERNFNVPTAALFFFVPENHQRFKFSSRGRAADGSWSLAFNEKADSSLIRAPDWRPIPTSGLVFVRDSGIVVRTVMKVDSKQGELRGIGQIDVRYARVDALDMWLPASMDESFEVSPRKGVWSRVTGHAEYSSYRTFTTSVRIK